MAPIKFIKMVEEWFLIKLLNRIDIRKPMSSRFFESLARIVVVTGIEAVVIRDNPKSGKTEILLVKRSENDPHWPNAFHVPGSILRKSDDGGYKDALNRVAKNELGISGFTKVEFAGTGFYPEKGRRGNNHGLIFLCGIDEDPRNGEFVAIEDLDRVYDSASPIEDRRTIIPLALERFEQKKE